MKYIKLVVSLLLLTLLFAGCAPSENTSTDATSSSIDEVASTTNGTASTINPDLIGTWSLQNLSSGIVTISFEENGRGLSYIDVPGYMTETSRSYEYRQNGNSIEFKYDEVGTWDPDVSTIELLTSTDLHLRHPDTGVGEYKRVGSTTTPPATIPTSSGTCTNTCSYADDGVCDDGGLSSSYSVCTLGTDCNDCGSRGVCTDTCSYANDGVCDDGGLNSSYSVCTLGTDCGDCGTRDEAVDTTATTGCNNTGKVTFYLTAATATERVSVYVDGSYSGSMTQYVGTGPDSCTLPDSQSHFTLTLGIGSHSYIANDVGNITWSSNFDITDCGCLLYNLR